MIFWLATLVSKITGWDISKVQRIVVIVMIALVGIAVLSFGLWAKSCWSAHKLKVTQAQIDKINNANEHDRKAELQKVIDDNADVVRTVDNRTAVSETNTIERNRVIDDKIKAADKAIQDAKAQGQDVTGEQLDCLLTGSNCQ